MIFPDELTNIAKFFNIGRGADLIFYLTHIISILLIILLWRVNQKLLNKITIITRNISISKPYKKKKKNNL